MDILIVNYYYYEIHYSSLAIPDYVQVKSRINYSSCSRYGEVDQAVGWHGEPHVIGAIALIPRCKKDEFFVSISPYLSVDLGIAIWSLNATTTEYYSIHKHFKGSGGDEIGNGI